MVNADVGYVAYLVYYLKTAINAGVSYFVNAISRVLVLKFIVCLC